MNLERVQIFKIEISVHRFKMCSEPKTRNTTTKNSQPERFERFYYPFQAEQIAPLLGK